jgi:F-type H+-transporting ATPase subunit alpha
MSMEEQVVSIFACTPPEGRVSWVRAIGLSDISRFESEMLEYVRANHSEVLAIIRDTGKLESDTEQKLVAALDAFVATFQASTGAGNQAA